VILKGVSAKGCNITVPDIPPELKYFLALYFFDDRLTEEESFDCQRTTFMTIYQTAVVYPARPV
jgi:hypothetical protein